MEVQKLLLDDIADEAIREVLYRMRAPNNGDGDISVPLNALRLASSLVEFAAFELATQQPSDRVSQLILLSAEIDRALARMTDVSDPPQAERNT